jgi:hypothetical protein
MNSTKCLTQISIATPLFTLTTNASQLFAVNILPWHG